MKNIILLTIIFAGASRWHMKPACDPMSFHFAGNKWVFPSTVESAVQTHQLDYKPPGYYYKKHPPGMEVILSYHFMPGDFFNEYQPKEVLFPRMLNSYVFQFNERPGLYDSLQTNIEQTFNRKFVLTRGMKDGKTLEEHEKPFEYNFLTVNSCLTIGIKRSEPRKQRKTVTVRFMYNLPLGRMGVLMGSY